VLGQLTSASARSAGYVTLTSVMAWGKSRLLLVMKRSAPSPTAVARCVASAARSPYLLARAVASPRSPGRLDAVQDEQAARQNAHFGGAAVAAWLAENF